MPTQLFVNLPTADVERAREFFSALGWTINPLFSDENAICVVIDENAYLMVLRRDFYQTFVPDKEVGDPASTSLALISFTLPSREAVTEFIERAAAAGATVSPTKDLGFMLQGAFDDPDGNHFEPFWMDPVAAENGPDAASA